MLCANQDIFCAISRCIVCLLCLFAHFVIIFTITLDKLCAVNLGFWVFFNALLFPCILSLYIHITVFDISMLLTVLISFVFLEVYIITVYVKRLAVACNIRRLINPMYYYYVLYFMLFVP